MGTWGTGIKSNDTSADIYEEFFQLYNEGKSSTEITEKLITDNKELIENKYDSNNFWLTLALCQWECKKLDNALFEKVKTIIESENDLLIWKELDANDSDIEKRKEELSKFLVKLQTERKTAKKPVKTKRIDSIFSKGDCLVYKMIDGNYGGAFVLTDEKNSEVGANFTAITDISQIEKPTLDDFKKSEVYIQRQKDFDYSFGKLREQWKDVPQIGLTAAIDFHKEKMDIEVIGNLKLYRDYKRGNNFMGLPWKQLLQIVPNKEEHQKKNGIPKTKIKLSRWTKWSLF